MSMTKYMHPRNIYKTPPDFKELAIKYPKFRKHAKQMLSGKVSIDFKNIEALRALTCTLLEKDFELIVEIPANKLIPTIPLRLNYLLWIEDLLFIADINTESVKITGVDIGTGSSCVYPLIGAKQYKWEMIATEMDAESYKYAVENVDRNGLSSLITVVKVDENSFLKDVLKSESVHFCMCNPPFFASKNELNFEFKSRKATRRKPNNAFSANLGEVVAHGGEVEFISKLIRESKELQAQIRIYTTMIGHKVSLTPLKKLLREADVVSFKQTEFCQGNTTRWGLAWTFCDIDLRKVPAATVAASRKEKHTPIIYDLLDCSKSGITLESVNEKLIAMFNSLKIDFKELKYIPDIKTYQIKARENTWSHQRRKRRLEQRLRSTVDFDNLSQTNNPVKDIEMTTILTENSKSSKNTENTEKSTQNCQNTLHIEDTVDLLQDMSVKSPSKRELEEDDDDNNNEHGFYKHKRMKVESVESSPEKSRFVLESDVILREEDGGFQLEMLYVGGNGGKDSLHQIMQYVKNNLKL